MTRPSGFTLAEACEYVRAQCKWTPEQLLEHRDAIAAALRSGRSVAAIATRYRLEAYALGLLASGLNEHEFAAAMNWSVREARDFRDSIERRLGVHQTQKPNPAKEEPCSTSHFATSS